MVGRRLATNTISAIPRLLVCLKTDSWTRFGVRWARGRRFVCLCLAGVFPAASLLLHTGKKKGEISSTSTDTVWFVGPGLVRLNLKFFVCVSSAFETGTEELHRIRILGLGEAIKHATRMRTTVACVVMCVLVPWRSTTTNHAEPCAVGRISQGRIWWGDGCERRGRGSKIRDVSFSMVKAVSELCRRKVDS